MSKSIAVFADVICPWCYLGKKHLERALADFSADEQPTIVSLPFELNPETPAEGMNRREYLESKYGSGSLKAAEERLVALGKEARIEYNFEKADFIPNTRKAHRLIWFAAQAEPNLDLEERLFFGYFTLGLDIGKNDVLEKIAAEAGLRLPEGFFDSEQGSDEVENLEREARRIGVQGVPFFILDNRLALSGAQPVSVFQQALSEAFGT